MNCQVCFFKIIVKRHLYHVNQDHYLLSEMVRHDSVITPDKNNYYEIVAHGSIQNITITLNKQAGDVKFYLSKNFTNKFPNETNYDFASEAETPEVQTINLIHNTEDLNTTLTGIYYISVIGKEPSYYDIVYHVRLNDTSAENKINNFINLNYGEIRRHIKTDTSPKYQYKIYYVQNPVDYDIKNKDILVNLTPMIGKFKIYVAADRYDLIYDESTKTMKNYVAATEKNELLLPKNISYYNNTIYLAVVPIQDPTAERSLLKIKERYFISIIEKDYPLNLPYNVPNQVELSKIYFTNYRYKLLVEKTNIANTVLSVVSQMNTQLFELKADFKPFWNASNSQTLYTITNTYNIDLKLKTEDLNKMTGEYCIGPSNLICYLFVEIKLTSPDDRCIFSLNYYLENVNKKLIRNFWNKGHLITGQYEYYKMLLEKGENGLISFNPAYSPLNLHYKLFEANATSIEYGKWVENTLSIVKSGNAFSKPNTGFYPIQKALTNQCGGYFCYLLILVESENAALGEYDYQINFSNKIIPLIDNLEIKSSISALQFTFYSLSVPIHAKNILISLTHITGIVNIFVRYGNILPSSNIYDWRGLGAQSKLIDINLNDIFFKKKSLDSLEGDYTILIYGQKESSFILKASYQRSPIQDINSLDSRSCQINNGICYFAYLGNSLVNSVVNVNFYYGTGILFSKQVNQITNSLINNLPKLENSDTSTVIQKTQNYIYIVNNSQSK